MANYYWTGANNASWSSTANWWITIGGTTTGGPPGAGDTAFFNANGTTTARTVYLAGNRPLGTFWMNGNAQGDITLRGGVSGGETTQTLTLGGIDMSGTSANAIFSSSVNIALANNSFWNVGSGRATLISGIVSGAFKLTSNNSGVIIFAGANTYSGGTDITAGTVRAGTSTTGAVTNGPFGTNTITMTGGALSSDSTTARSIANALSLNGTMTLGDATNTGLLTFSGSTTIAGTTVLSIPANYILMQGVFGGTGAFTLSSGELDLEGATGTKSGGTTVAGGILYLGFGKTSSDQLGSDSLTITSGSANFCGSSTATITNNITGSGGFLVARPRNATLTFSNAAAYTGTARLLAGASDGAGTTSQGMTFSSASFPAATSFSFVNQNTAAASMTQTFKYTGSASTVTTAATISMTPTAAVTCVWDWSPSTANAPCTINGLVSSTTTVAHTLQLTNDASVGLLSLTGGISQLGAGVLTLTKTGTGSVTLSGASTFTGNTTVSAGTLNANHATALGFDTVSSSVTVANGASLSLGAAPNYAQRSLTLQGGTGVGVFAGALILATAGTHKFASVTVGATGTYIRATQSATLNNAITATGFVLQLGAASGTTLTLSQAISASGLSVGYYVQDRGKVALTTASPSLSGSTTLWGYATLSLGNDWALGTSTLVFNGGTLDASTNLTVANALTVSDNILFAGTAALTLSSAVALGASRIILTDLFAGALTLSGVVSNGSASACKLTKAGTNTLVLTNANTYSGGTDIGAGTLQAGNTQALGTSGTVTLSVTAVLQTLTGTGPTPQNGKLTVAALTNSAGGTIKIGG